MILGTALYMIMRSCHSMCQFQIYINDKMVVSCGYKTFYNDYMYKFEKFRCDEIRWHCHESIYEIFLTKKGYKDNGV